jgi:membrane fusion protein, type I secretion system
MTRDAASAYQSIQRYLFVGIGIVFFLTFGIGGWAMTTELSGAVIAQGFVIVDSSVKKVQHPTGGIVGELRVRDGDAVKANDILVRLDETQTRAQAAIVAKNLDDLNARQARLEAERDNSLRIEFPLSFVEYAAKPASDASPAIIAERNLFALRRQARDGQKAQLRERVAQLRNEIEGYLGQADAKKREIELIHKELESVRNLWQRNLIPINRLTVLERDAARLEGDRSYLIGVTAQARGKIAEIELQIIQVDQELRSEVGKELIDVRSKISELIERKVAAEDQLKRIDIRAPQSGLVHQLAVHTVGGVINAGESIMLIVPDADTLSVEVKIPPHEINKIYVGQSAFLRFSSFNEQTSPEVGGEVSLISADLTQDQRTGMSYYTARIMFKQQDLSRLGSKIVPGMPVETFLQTGGRTALSYLLKPLRDQAVKAFK